MGVQSLCGIVSGLPSPPPPEMCRRALCVSLVGLAAGNFVSPGLGKCLDMERKKVKDASVSRYQGVVELSQPNEAVQAILYECHDDFNQQFVLTENNRIQPRDMPKKCLAASEEPAGLTDGANVRFIDCVAVGDAKEYLQKWIWTGYGQVKLEKVGGGNPKQSKCLDVKAQKVGDDYETWEEIKKHESVPVQLFACHDPEKTERVNQLWAWQAWRDGVLSTGV